MNKELTSGEAMQILDSIKKEHPTPDNRNFGQLELTAYAYIKGYEAAKNEREV